MPHCSEVYKRDAMSVFNEGVANTETPVTHYTFITFTAPGAQMFGRTHQRVVKKRKAKKSHVVRCSCKHTHREDDVRIGTPIDPPLPVRPRRSLQRGVEPVACYHSPEARKGPERKTQLRASCRISNSRSHSFPCACKRCHRSGT